MTAVGNPPEAAGCVASVGGALAVGLGRAGVAAPFCVGAAVGVALIPRTEPAGAGVGGATPRELGSGGAVGRGLEVGVGVGVVDVPLSVDPGT